MKIGLENFRGFRSTGLIDVRPITLLVGENSSGKTSFLAATRYLLRLGPFNSSSSGGFNQAPFYLGGFEDIAHRRVGRNGGISKSFTLAIQRPTSTTRSHFSAIRPHELPKEYYISLEFSEWLGQPALNRAAFKVKNQIASIDLVEATITLSEESTAVRRTIDYADQSREQLEFVRRTPSGIGSMFSQLQGFSLGKTFVPAMANNYFKNLREEDLELFSRFSIVFDTAYHAFFDQNSNAERTIIALAPIRNEPRRVYEVVDTQEAPSGAHVPLRLAQQKIQNPVTWKTQSEYLADFGKRAGLFSKIDIKRLGSTQNDPFQIMVTVSGSKRNIMDVGYGVSQVLPLLYEMSEGRSQKTILIQQPEVHLHPRAQAELGSLIIESNRKAKHRFLIETHSDFVLDRIRTHIRTGLIPTSDVSLLYFDHKGNDTSIHQIELDNSGNVIDPPLSYRDFFYREEKSLLGF